MGILGRRRIMSSDDRHEFAGQQVAGFPPPMSQDAFLLRRDDCAPTRDRGSVDASDEVDFVWELVVRLVLLQATLVATISYNKAFFYCNTVACVSCLALMTMRVLEAPALHRRRNAKIMQLLGMGLLFSGAVCEWCIFIPFFYATTVAGALMAARRRGETQPPDEEADHAPIHGDEGNKTEELVATTLVFILLGFLEKHEAPSSKPTQAYVAREYTEIRAYVTLYSKCSENSTKQPIQVRHEKRRNWLQATPLFKIEQLMKRCIKKRINCTGKKPAIISVSFLLSSVNLLLDSDGSARQHQNNLTDERNDKTRSNGAPSTNNVSSDETARTPTAQKLIANDEKENHSDPASCVAERGVAVDGKEAAPWYVATGAACHATGDSELITDLLQVDAGNEEGLCVHAADGTAMPVRGRGSVVTNTVVLPDVYYVPGLRTNLVSVGQLAGRDYSVAFGRGACVFSSAAGRVVGRAHAGKDGLYKVDFLVIPLDMR